MRRWSPPGCPTRTPRGPCPSTRATIVAGLTAPSRNAASAPAPTATPVPSAPVTPTAPVTAAARRRRPASPGRRARRRPRRAPRRRPPQPVGRQLRPQLLGQRLRAGRGVEVLHGDVDDPRRPAGRLGGELGEAGQRPRRGPDPLERLGCSRRRDREDGLDRQRRPEERRRRPDPASASQVLEGVDVEGDRRSRAARDRATAATSSGAAPRAASSAADRTAYPMAMPRERESTTVTGTGDCWRRAGRTARSPDMSAERWTDTTAVGALGGGLLVGLEERLRRRP